MNTWNTEALPFLKSTEQRLDELARRNVENLRWSMLKNLNVSFSRFASRIKERLSETVAATQGAMEAAGERRNACGGSIAVETARLEENIAVLEKLKTDFTALRAGLAQTAGSANSGFDLNPSSTIKLKKLPNFDLLLY